MLLGNELGRTFGKGGDGRKWIHSHSSRNNGTIAYYQARVGFGAIAPENLTQVVGYALLPGAVGTHPSSPSVRSHIRLAPPIREGMAQLEVAYIGWTVISWAPRRVHAGLAMKFPPTAAVIFSRNS